MIIQKTAEFHILTNLNMSNKDLLALVLKDHKDAKTTEECISWYKTKLRNKNLLAKKSGSASKYDKELEELKAKILKQNEQLAKLEAEAKK